MQIHETVPAQPYASRTATPDPQAARRRTWWAVALIILAIGVGATWDGLWHVTHVFNGFFTPPHVFIYAMCLIASGVALGMLLTPRVRLALGVSFRVSFIPYPVPGALFLLGGGLAMAGIAGLVFDNLWHSNFGLDETGWSFPHAMIGWSILMATLGAIACRFAVRPAIPLRWYTILFIGYSAIGASAAPLLGPLHANRSIGTEQAISHISVLAAQPPFQHTLRIIETWNLTRTNPLLILLAPLWAGAALAFIRKLDRRAWVMLLLAGLWSFFDLSRNQAISLSRYVPNLATDPASWREIPLYVPALLIVILPALRMNERRTWLIAGGAFGLAIFSIFDTQAWATLLAIPGAALMLVGKSLGECVYGILDRPDTLRATLSLLLVGVAYPAMTGMVDLALRWSTP